METLVLLEKLQMFRPGSVPLPPRNSDGLLSDGSLKVVRSPESRTAEKNPSAPKAPSRYTPVKLLNEASALDRPAVAEMVIWFGTVRSTSSRSSAIAAPDMARTAAAVIAVFILLSFFTH